MTKTIKLDLIPMSILQDISSYLTQRQVIQLSSVSSFLRQIITAEDFWGVYTIDSNAQNWYLFAKWFKYHSETAKFKRLHVSTSTSGLFLSNLMNVLNGAISNLQELRFQMDFYNGEIQQQLAMILLSQTHSLKKLSLNFLIKNKGFKNLLNNLDTLSFTNQSSIIQQKHINSLPIVKYLNFRPYRVNFTSFINYIHQNQTLQQLKLDCEQCSQILINRMLSSLNSQTLSSLSMEHLENMNSESAYLLGKFTKITKLCLTKTFNITNFGWLSLFESYSFPHLTTLNLTQAVDLEGKSFQLLVERSPCLRSVNISWCCKVSNNSIFHLISKCEDLQELIVVGSKELNDCAFKSFQFLKEKFNQKYYYQYRQKINNKQPVFFDIKNFFLCPYQDPLVLKKLKLLDCQSVNYVSDTMLQVIGILRKNAKITNYYGNLMGVHDRDQQINDD